MNNLPGGGGAIPYGGGAPCCCGPVYIFPENE